MLFTVFVKKSKTTFLSKNDIMVWFTYLLDNIYIKYGQAIYRQIIGIPMGTDCAPELANLFLFTYEYRYICNLIETGSTDLKRFKYIYRYIDDLITLCDHGYFDRIFKDIYPPELELKPISISTSEANYLDMNIKVADDHSHFLLINLTTKEMSLILR